MTSSEIALSPRLRSIAGLANALFKAEVPEETIRALPAETLYLAIKHLGVAASGDILETATIEQCRLLIDFDCWRGDQFDEDNFWEWLSIADDEHGLRVLQKLVKSFDLKLIALVISRHVEAQAFEEKTENPPGPGFMTPDQGHTWVHVTLQEGSRHFMLTRLLALIFETNAQMFYQILSVPNVATPSGLEEEAFVERTRRLSAEGIPDAEFAHELNAPLTVDSALKATQDSAQQSKVRDVPGIEPLVYENLGLMPLGSLLQELKSREDFESELSLLMNAALVRWKVDFCEQEQVKNLVNKVRGAVNIGLEKVQQRSELPISEIFSRLGLQKIYRVGLTEIQKVFQIAKKIPAQEVEKLSLDPLMFGILAGARVQFPEVPQFLAADGSVEEHDGRLVPGHRAFEHYAEIELVLKILQQKSL